MGLLKFLCSVQYDAFPFYPVKAKHLSIHLEILINSMWIYFSEIFTFVILTELNLTKSVTKISHNLKKQ